MLGAHQILATTVQIWLELKNDGLSSLMVSDFLTKDDFREIKRKAQHLSKSWYLPYESLLEYRGINLGELCRIDNIEFFYEVVMANKVMEHILSKPVPNEVIVFADLKIPCIGDTRYNATHDIFEAVVLDMAEKRVIPVRKLYLPAKESIKNKLKKTPAVRHVLPLLRFAKKIIRQTLGSVRRFRDKQKISISSINAEKEKYLVLCLAGEYDAFIVWPVLKALSESGKFEGILVSGSRPRLKGANRSGIEDDEAIKYIPVRDFKGDNRPQDLAAYSRFIQAKEKFANDLHSGSRRLEKPLCNRFLEVQYNYLWEKYFPAAIKMIDTGYRMFDRIQPNALITEDMESYSLRILGKIAKARGIKSVSMPHGCINDIEGYEFESDIFLAWGEISKRQLIYEYGYTDQSIKVVGSAIMEKVKRSLNEAQKENPLQKTKYGFNGDSKIILIMTCGFTSEVYGRLDLKDYITAWDEIANYALSHPEIEFIIKPHPSTDYVDWYHDYFGKKGIANIRTMKNVKLESILPTVDIAVMFQIISTAVLVALLAGVPLLFIQNAIRTGCGHPSDDWNAENGLTVIDKSNDIKTALDSLQNDKIYRQNVIENGKRFLDNYLYEADGTTAERIVAECEALVES